MNRKINNYLREIPNYLSFFIAASFIVSLSPILIEMGKTFNTDAGELNLIYTWLTLGTITGRVASFFYRARFKNLHIILAAYSVLAVMVIALSQSGNLVFFYIIYFICGHMLGIILVISTENLLKSGVKDKDRLITIATSFFPVGALVAPRLVAVLVDNELDWKYLYYVLFFMLVIMITLYSTITRRQSYVHVDGKEKLIFKGIFTDKRKNTIFLIMVFSLLFYIMAEFVLSNWAPTFFRLKDLLNIDQAGNMITIFWASIIAGRAIISPITGKLRPVYIMLGLAVSGVAAAIFLFLAEDIIIIYTLTGLSGLSFSGLFPLIFAKGSTIYKKGEGSLSTIMFLSAGAGMSLTSFLSRTISRKSLVLSVSMAPIYIGVLGLLVTVYLFYTKSNGSG